MTRTMQIKSTRKQPGACRFPTRNRHPDGATATEGSGRFLPSCLRFYVPSCLFFPFPNSAFCTLKSAFKGMVGCVSVMCRLWSGCVLFMCRLCVGCVSVMCRLCVGFFALRARVCSRELSTNKRFTKTAPRQTDVQCDCAHKSTLNFQSRVSSSEVL